MLTVITYFWRDPNFANSYEPDDVRRLRQRVAKYLPIRHEFACITDQPEAFVNDPDIRAIQIDWATHVPGTCFVRLMTFHPNMVSWVGERVFQMDLDTLPVGDFSHVVNRHENLVLWRNPSRVPWDNPVKRGRPFYNGSFILHRCGTMPHLWGEFNPDNPGCPEDQSWISRHVGPNAPYWDGSHGVYRLARRDTPGSGVWGELPDNACLITFPGSDGKPSDPEIRAENPWIEAYEI